MELFLRHNNKKLITHVNRIKPYFVQKPAAVTSPDFFPAEKPATPPPVAVQQEADENFFPYNLLPRHRISLSLQTASFRALGLALVC